MEYLARFKTFKIIIADKNINLILRYNSNILWDYLDENITKCKRTYFSVDHNT